MYVGWLTIYLSGFCVTYVHIPSLHSFFHPFDSHLITLHYIAMVFFGIIMAFESIGCFLHTDLHTVFSFFFIVIIPEDNNFDSQRPSLIIQLAVVYVQNFLSFDLALIF